MSDPSATDAASEIPETVVPNSGTPVDGGPEDDGSPDAGTTVVETAAPATVDAEETKARADRKVREGLVVSNANDQTAVVRVTDRVRHRRYAKTVQRSTKLHVHDADNATNVGDRVRIVETRPLSKLKRWRLVEILERAR